MKRENDMIKENDKQAGAELCQAQVKLELDEPTIANI